MLHFYEGSMKEWNTSNHITQARSNLAGSATPPPSPPPFNFFWHQTFFLHLLIKKPNYPGICPPPPIFGKQAINEREHKRIISDIEPLPPIKVFMIMRSCEFLLVFFFILFYFYFFLSKLLLSESQANLFQCPISI